MLETGMTPATLQNILLFLGKQLFLVQLIRSTGDQKESLRRESSVKLLAWTIALQQVIDLLEKEIL
jgi:hypothetical protein